LPLVEGEVLSEDCLPISLLDRLLDGEIEWFLVSPEGRQFTGATMPNLALLSGSFNPLHDGHRQLAETAEAILDRPVLFELPLVNAVKAPIAAEEARRRIAQFTGQAPVLLTRTPLFSQKADLFPGSVFVVGVDTAERFLQQRFYHDDPAEMEAALRHFQATGCYFLVAGRLQGDQFITLADIDVPPAYQSLFQPIPEDHFRLDISSTALRHAHDR
jgi:cytidyltransferase-like protein